MKNENRCLKCNRKLTNKESIKLGYGKTCFRIMNAQKPKENVKDILDFMRLEIKLLKIQVKELKIYGNKQDTIERIKQVKTEILDEVKQNFSSVVNELKEIFKPNFHYKDFLKAEVRETIENPPKLYI